MIQLMKHQNLFDSFDTPQFENLFKPMAQLINSVPRAEAPRVGPVCSQV